MYEEYYKMLVRSTAQFLLRFGEKVLSLMFQELTNSVTLTLKIKTKNCVDVVQYDVHHNFFF